MIGKVQGITIGNMGRRKRGKMQVLIIIHLDFELEIASRSVSWSINVLLLLTKRKANRTGLEIDKPC